MITYYFNITVLALSNDDKTLIAYKRIKEFLLANRKSFAVITERHLEIDAIRAGKDDDEIVKYIMSEANKIAYRCNEEKNSISIVCSKT